MWAMAWSANLILSAVQNYQLALSWGKNYGSHDDLGRTESYTCVTQSKVPLGGGTIREQS